MLNTPQHTKEAPLDALENSALQKIIEERTRKILSESDEEKEVQDAIDTKRGVLFSRLRELHENPFHNIDHAFAVHGRLSTLLQNLKYPVIIPKRKQLLLLESALRHDDGHVGNRYRQDVIEGAEMSNEELAVLLMESDFRDSGLTSEDKLFMKNAILATTSWQRMLPKSDTRHRSYGPNTLEEKLLVFADVGEVLIGGWDTWKKESENIDIELWKHSLAERRQFLSYVESLYEGLKEHFTDRFCNRIEDNVREVRERLKEAETHE